MFELYGLRSDSIYGYGGWTGEKEEVRDLLATFDDEYSAQRYAEDSKLAAAHSLHFYPDIKRGKYKFRKISLLRNYEDYEIVEKENNSIEHNPVLQFL